MQQRWRIEIENGRTPFDLPGLDVVRQDGAVTVLEGRWTQPELFAALEALRSRGCDLVGLLRG